MNVPNNIYILNYYNMFLEKIKNNNAIPKRKKGIHKSIYFNHLKAASSKIRLYLISKNIIRKYPLTRLKDMIIQFSLILEIPIEKNESLTDWLVQIYRSGECEYCSKTDITFLSTSEWRELKKLVYQTYENKCMKCGCLEKLHVDHIKPSSKYPELINKFTNLQILCSTCNISKGNRNEIDYRNY